MACVYPPLCPAGCYTNHGGHFGRRQLERDWRFHDLAWEDWARQHGRLDLIWQAPAAEQEAATT